MKAWELIDAAGCRGLTRGGAQVSEKHCNFLINTGTATAADLEGLGEEVRRRVNAATGVTLGVGDPPHRRPRAWTGDGGMTQPQMSWPGVARPSTSSCRPCSKDVDGRATSGHDRGFQL